MKETLKKVMKRAWEIKREDSRNIFAECLKMAWAEIKKVAKAGKIQIVEIKQWFLRKMDTITFMAIDSGICTNDIVLEKETEKAIQISTEWNGRLKYIWLPKSVVVYR